MCSGQLSSFAFLFFNSFAFRGTAKATLILLACRLALVDPVTDVADGSSFRKSGRPLGGKEEFHDLSCPLLIVVANTFLILKDSSSSLLGTVAASLSSPEKVVKF